MDPGKKGADHTEAIHSFTDLAQGNSVSPVSLALIARVLHLLSTADRKWLAVSLIEGEEGEATKGNFPPQVSRHLKDES
jgi:hypothetical protein